MKEPTITLWDRILSKLGLVRGSVAKYYVIEARRTGARNVYTSSETEEVSE